MPNKKSTSPTQRSLKLLRAAGWHCQVTERWNPFAKVRQDLFGFIDILCMKGDELMAVQTTSGDHAANRIQKIKDSPLALMWVQSPSRTIMVHGWRKIGSPQRWECREERVMF